MTGERDTMEDSGRFPATTLPIGKLIEEFNSFDFACSFCVRIFSENLSWVLEVFKRRKNFKPEEFEEVLYSPLRKSWVPYPLGYFDKRVYFSSNSYRPPKPTISKKSNDSIEYYFKENVLCFVKSGNLYQVEGDEAFSFNEDGRFACGAKFVMHGDLNRSVFVEGGGTEYYDFYTDISRKTGLLISINSYSFVISEYRRTAGKWRERRIVQKGLFPLENALGIVKSFHPYWSDRLSDVIVSGYRLLQSNGWKTTNLYF